MVEGFGGESRAGTTPEFLEPRGVSFTNKRI